MVVERTDQPKYWPPAGSISSTSFTVDCQGVGQGSKEPVRKLWEFYGYKSTEDMNNEEETESVTVINYSQGQLGTMIENISGDDSIMAWIDEANDRQPVFPKEDNDASWDVGTDQGFVMCR